MTGQRPKSEKAHEEGHSLCLSAILHFVTIFVPVGGSLLEYLGALFCTFCAHFVVPFGGQFFVPYFVPPIFLEFLNKNCSESLISLRSPKNNPKEYRTRLKLRSIITREDNLSN